MANKKLGFALGGGGARGVAHIGFLQAMEEAGIKPDYIAGCSMGSVVGAAYASGLPLAEIKEIILNLKPTDLLLPAVKKGGVFTAKKIAALMRKHLGEVNFEDLKIPFRCISVDISAQKLVCFARGSVAEAVAASSCIPGAFAPYDMGGKLYADGGVLERVPVVQTKEMGADIVVAMDVMANLRFFNQDDEDEEKSVMKKLLDNINIFNENTLTFIQQAFAVIDNDRTAKRRKECKDIIDLWLEPELDDMSPFAFKQLGFAYDKGYEIGKKNTENILALIK